MTLTRTYHGSARRELIRLRKKLRFRWTAEAIWEKLLNEEERAQLLADFESGQLQVRCPAMWWAWVKGVSLSRAVVDLATELHWLRPYEAAWLLSTLGLKSGCPQDVRAAVKAGHLVLIVRPKAMYWRGREVDVSLMKPAVWKYWCKLAEHAKLSRPLSRFDLGDRLKERYLSKLKSRLINECGLPLDLGERIAAAGRGDQRLDIPPSTIHCFQGIKRIEFQEITNRNPLRP